jgi:hypothetical protein
MHQNRRGSSSAKEIDNDIEHLRMQNRGRLEIFARGRRSRQHKNPGANDGANSERRQADPAQRFLQFSFGVFCICDQLIDVLTPEELWVHPYAPLASARVKTLATAGHAM